VVLHAEVGMMDLTAAIPKGCEAGLTAGLSLIQIKLETDSHNDVSKCLI
jgi:hypothetical protein